MCDGRAGTPTTSSTTCVCCTCLAGYDRVLAAYFHGMMRMFLELFEQTNAAQPLTSNATCGSYEHFAAFLEKLAQDDWANENIRYLARLQPYLQAYFGLYTAVRTGNWPLRNASLQRLGVMFFAYNRPKYTVLVAHAMVNKVMLPRKVLAQMEQGEFTVSFKGHRGANVALDEALEMGANR